ncbi:hypothetical protein PSI9734_01442 [Pseudidiomarina piscicola]|uniref:Uncharacterized protein n=1 Tax=Pseudidiomarina piscicola TaxID=2614830 RepID=A0A6S6WPZ2_9GAMM|nr:hypothetical protein [Pseudidiomarina piscicola]CAB0151024.1 hypothetical protein PSI9734_01442 [Pseudidiomarina piscicola]VZT40535.1 hypothetical protein PSI9734_01442 [Pseudomonas aeruginosa]
MKTATLKTVTALSAVIVLAAISAPAAAQVETEATAKVQAMQVYRYTYQPDNFNGSIEHEMQLMQQSLMANVSAENVRNAEQALATSANQLSGLTQFAQTTSAGRSERAPDQLFGRASYPFSRSYQVHL